MQEGGLFFVPKGLFVQHIPEKPVPTLVEGAGMKNERMMEPAEILNCLEGRASDSDRKRLVEWLDASPEHVKEFEEIRWLFEMTKIYNAELRPAAAVSGGRRGLLRPMGRRLAGIAAGIAAVVALCVGAGYFAHLNTVDAMSGQFVSLQVPAGQRMEMTLADGTRVWLNSGARFEYPAVFGRQERMVRLSGEALFDVEHDADHPFIVRTFASDVEVLGTRFNVDADEERQHFATTLLEGHLRLTDRQTRSDVELYSGDEARWSGGGFSVGKARDLDVVCWTEGLIDIRGFSFGELMRKFETAYNVRIRIDRPTMPVLGFTSGKIRISDGIDHALRVLQHTSDFTFVHDLKLNTVTIH